MRLIITPFPDIINSGNACLQGISVWHEKKIGISDSASITYNRGWRVHAGYQKFLFNHSMKELIMELELECFECLVCGYVYNPEEGDPGGAIPPGMTFFSLPDDWLCPECSAGKNEFALVEL